MSFFSPVGGMLKRRAAYRALPGIACEINDYPGRKKRWTWAVR